MRISQIISVILFLFISNVYAIEKLEGFNLEVLKVQRISTLKIISLLQENKKDSLNFYVDSITLIGNTKLINKAVKEIRKYYKNSELRSGGAVMENDYYVIRSSYFYDKKYRFQINFYFDKTNPNSKVKKISIKTYTELEKERIKRLEFQKQNPNFIPPEPPNPN